MAARGARTANLKQNSGCWIWFSDPGTAKRNDARTDLARDSRSAR
jgi:hypothetical protein